MERFHHLFLSPRDFDHTLNFFRNILGWSMIADWGGAGEPRGAILRGAEMECVIAEPHEASDSSWSEGRNGHRPTLHILCDDLEERYRRLLTAGADIIVPPEKTHWGVRWLVVKDPDDNLIAFFEESAARAS